jgi:septal ring factor EnvC (AmiA/AmiB activator)
MTSGSGKTPSHLLTSGHEELENARSSARLYFESRGLEVPSFLKPRKASASLEVELATVRADTEAVKRYLAETRAETAQLRAEAQRLEKEHREWESSAEGQQVLQLRSENRQLLSNILQIDADVARRTGM